MAITMKGRKHKPSVRAQPSVDFPRQGEHEVVARLVASAGRAVSAEPHEFFVERENRPA